MRGASPDPSASTRETGLPVDSGRRPPYARAAYTIGTPKKEAGNLASVKGFAVAKRPYFGAIRAGGHYDCLTPTFLIELPVTRAKSKGIHSYSY